MNLKTLSLSIVAAVAASFGSSTANAQFASSGTGFSVGVGGGYSKTTLPNGQTIKNSNLNWGVGVGGVSTNSTLPWGGGGWGGGWGGFGGGYYAPSVLPFYGGGYGYGWGTPVFASYSPFTGTFGNPCYTPQYPLAPAAFLPQAPVCW
jgi:hypothetical protein